MGELKFPTFDTVILGPADPVSSGRSRLPPGQATQIARTS